MFFRASTVLPVLAIMVVTCALPINQQKIAHTKGCADCTCRVVPQAQLMPETLKLAKVIASNSMPVVAKAKDCIKRAMEVSLYEGLRYEQ